jgi:hypothetical protein
MKSLIRQKELEEKLNIPDQHKNYMNALESNILISNSLTESEKPKITTEGRPYFIAIPENFLLLYSKKKTNITGKGIKIDQTNWQDWDEEKCTKKGWIFMDFEITKKGYTVKKVWMKEIAQPLKSDESSFRKYNMIAKRIFERMKKLPTRPL